MIDAEPERTGDSLVGRIARVRPRLDRRGWRVAVVVALLIIAGPLLTIAGARLLEEHVRGETLLIERSPATVAARAADVQQSALRQLLARQAIVVTLDGLARTLPYNASLTFIEANGEGALRIEVATPDPDRVRAALRRDPATAALRDAGQRRGGGVMLVTLERAP